jgi:hypothetical protein
MNVFREPSAVWLLPALVAAIKRGGGSVADGTLPCAAPAQIVAVLWHRPDAAADLPLAAALLLSDTRTFIEARLTPSAASALYHACGSWHDVDGAVVRVAGASLAAFPRADGGAPEPGLLVTALDYDSGAGSERLGEPCAAIDDAACVAAWRALAGGRDALAVGLGRSDAARDAVRAIADATRKAVTGDDGGGEGPALPRPPPAGAPGVGRWRPPPAARAAAAWL